MDCKKVSQHLVFYQEGSLSVRDEKRISEHLESCSECSAKLAFIENSFATLDTIKAEKARPFLFTRIQGRMEQGYLYANRRVFIPLAIASMLLVGIFVGSFAGKALSNEKAYQEYSVSYLFNDMNLENAEQQLLN